MWRVSAVTLCASPQRQGPHTMSWQATQAVSLASGIKGAARAVLYALAQHADQSGANAFPSQARIADEAGCSDRTVRRALAWLEERNIIVRMGGRKSRRGRAVVVWRLMLGFLRSAKPDMVSRRTAKQLTKKALGNAERSLFLRQKAKQARINRRVADLGGWERVIQLTTQQLVQFGVVEVET